MEQLAMKEIVDTAIQFLHQLYDQKELRNVMLEELEHSEEDSLWLITLGFDAPYYDNSVAFNLSQALQKSPSSQRVYKTIQIDDQTGEAVAMKIRKV